MKELNVLFPMGSSLAQTLELIKREFLTNKGRMIQKEKDIELIKNDFILEFEKLKLNIAFDKDFEPNVITEKHYSTYSERIFTFIETRDYRFKITKGDGRMFWIHSGGSISYANPPTGYFDKGFKHLYVRVSYEKQRDDSKKEDFIVKDLKQQKDAIEKCISDQCAVIDSFVANNINRVEHLMREDLKRIQEEKSLGESLKNKLSEL